MPRPTKPARSHASFSRRRFLGAAAASTAALAMSRTRVMGANDRINVGFIALGGRGSGHVKWFDDLSKPASAEGKGANHQPENVGIASLCDVDQKILGTMHKKYPGAKAELDFRKMLDDKGVDAVVIATCNHWHALAAVWAIQAGKDVYVEKPVSNNVWEGRKIVEAARKYKKIVQGGTQQRSDPVQKQIRDFIKSGKLGAMKWIRGNRYGVDARGSIGKLDKPLTPPADVNYDLWLGPAQDLPIFRKKFHYDWHWVWNTGAGEMGNWGVHILDDIRNMLDDKCSLPKGVLSAGGRVGWNDAGETPNVHTVYFDTGIVPVIFSLSNLPFNKERATQATVWRGQPQSGYVIAFEEGYYAGARGGGWVLDKDWKKVQQFKGDAGGLHARNFIEACRTRDPKHLNAEIEVCHYSSSWCHLANVAYRLGQAYTREQHEAAAKGFGPWSELVDGFHKHLDANEIDPVKAGLKVSGMLQIDPEKETFVGPGATPEALSLLRREYRKGYVMPEQV